MIKGVIIKFSLTSRTTRKCLHLNAGEIFQLSDMNNKVNILKIYRVRLSVSLSYLLNSCVCLVGQRAPVNAAMNLRVPKCEGNFLAS